MMDWSKQRILVTGGHGFLGGFLVDRLRRLAAVVVSPRARDFDLVDPAAVRALLAEVQPTLVFHLAASVGGIGANEKNPARFFYENAIMGIQLLHECWRSRVRKLVAVATVCAYPRDCPVPFREADLWNGYPEETNAPYGIAKKILSVQSQAYRTQYGFNSVVLYPVNLYGPRDNFDLETSHVIPAMLRKFSDARAQGKEEVLLWGDGTPTREFFYVDDCARALVLAAERYDSSAPMNLGSGEEVSMRALAERIRTLVGFEGRIKWDVRRPNGQPRRRLDTSRARASLGFVSEVGLDDGLQRTHTWWLRNRD